MQDLLEDTWGSIDIRISWQGVAHNDGDCKCFHKRARVTESA